MSKQSNHPKANGHVQSNDAAAGKRSNGLVIPIQKIAHHWSNESDDSFESFTGGNVNNTEPMSASVFLKPFGGSHAASSLNVYSMSPRTSVLYDYYLQPKGFYESQGPLTHPSKSNGHYCTSDHNKANHKEVSRTISDCCEQTGKPSSPLVRGIPLSIHNEIMEDSRRRAWSESAKDPRKTTMHMHRTSALKRIRMKLQKGGHKKKEESNHYDSLNQSTDSTNSFEKSGERNNARNASPSSSKRNTVNDIDVEMGMLSLHPDDASWRKSGEMSPVPQVSPVFGHRPRLLSPLSQDTELIYQRFLEEHTCYDIMPTSCKLVVFDTRLSAKKAFHALIENAVRSAPLWDAAISCYVGMLTVTDFINVILNAHRDGNTEVESIENETIDTWRKLLNQQSSFASVHPDDSLLHSLKVLINEHFHGVPVMDEATGDIFHVVNHKRILRFLHLFINELPKPAFMEKTLSDVKIGTYNDVATVTRNDSMLDVLEVLVNKKLSAIPVVDEDGQVEDVFCKLDMVSLAAQGLYHDLSTSLDEALACRFKPLFEDEETQADAFSRFSSPRPQRRDINIRRKFPAGNDVTSTPERPSQFLSRFGNGTPKNHQVTRTKKSSLTRHHHASGDVVTQPHSPNIRQMSAPLDSSFTHDCAGFKVRHKSLSNPLVKCRLNDTLKFVIDLMVNTEANLLVVVGPSNNHVIGVITVSDVLHFIINPLDNTLDSHSSSQLQRRSRHQFTSTSSSSSRSSLNRTRSSFYDESLSSSPHFDSSNLACF